MAADELKAFVDFPTVTATISSVAYSVLVNESSGDADLMDGGQWVGYNIQMLIERASLANLPAIGTTVVMSTGTYSIMSTQQDDAQAYWTLNLRNKNAPK